MANNALTQWLQQEQSGVHRPNACPPTGKQCDGQPASAAQCSRCWQAYTAAGMVASRQELDRTAGVQRTPDGRRSQYGSMADAMSAYYNNGLQDVELNQQHAIDQQQQQDDRPSVRAQQAAAAAAPARPPMDDLDALAQWCADRMAARGTQE